MMIFRPFGTLLALLLLSTQVSADEATPLEDRDWQLVSTKNFRLHSVLEEERTVELLRHLEAMRMALVDADSDASYSAIVPTTIIALDIEDDYYQLGVPKGSIGYFIADIRENAIVVLDNKFAHGVQTILHEYAHYLSNQQRRADRPRWYEEGQAEFLSSSSLSDGTFEYGLPIQDRVGALPLSNWLPFKKVLELTNVDELSMFEVDQFYSQSWLLVHYLNSQPGGEQGVAEGLMKYNDLIVEGFDRVAAFERAFAMRVESLEKTLSDYLKAGEFKTRSVAMDTSMPDFTPVVEPLAKSVVQIALGRMAMRFGNDEEAEEWFSGALSDMSTKAYAEAGLGTVLGSRGLVARAEARFEAAIYLVSYDFRMWMDYGKFWAERISETLDFERRKFYGKRLEEALRNALTISDATPELNYMMGFAYLAQGKDPDEAIEFLLAAIEQSPADQSSRLLLAEAYLYTERVELAVEVAESVLSLQHDRGPITIAARDVIDRAHQLLAD